MRFVFLFFLLVSILNCSINPTPKSPVIHIKGSDTMLILNQQLAKEYMETHPRISIYVEGGGSGSGIKALINRNVEIAAMSRTLRPKEFRLLAEEFNTVGLSFLIAKDALSVYVNPDKNIYNLTLSQLKDIFTGNIKNWKEVGRKNNPITVLTRPPNSGTFLYFKEHVLNEEPYSNEAVTMPTTKSIVQFISDHPNAIGYGGTAYGQELIHCHINDIEPTIQNIRNDEYPITRYLYYYTVDSPKETIKSFIDWVLSEEGQHIVNSVGYISLWGER